jgi:predicted HTH transcriptional regulator
LTYFSFPQNHSQWTLEHIDELIKLKDIEGVNFDFKSKDFSQGKGLVNHICAMSNVIGGYIVLGVDEHKENGELIRFKKNGFSFGEEDKVKQSIFNYASQIEPLSSVDLSRIIEKDSKTFYYVIQIYSIDNNKPYFVKTTKLCYIRMGNRSEPVDRFTILNLYSKFEEKRKDFSSKNSHSSIKGGLQSDNS